MITPSALDPLRKRWWANANLPKRMSTRTLEDLDDVPSELERWVDAVLDGRILGATPSELSGVGLALIGKPGHGKTSLACAALLEIITSIPTHGFEYRKQTFSRPTAPVRFMYYPEMLSLAQAAFRDPDGMVQSKVDQLFARSVDPVQVLVVDDLGKEHRTGSHWAENFFDHLVRARFDEGCPTIVTTNVALPNWASIYGESMASFAHEALTPLAILSPKGDRRL